jgi:lysophospholipid acyltransferase (LPLAT)-like uncharacterized protein
MEIDQQRRFSQIDRLKIRLVSWIGYWAIALVGRSLRWEVKGLEHLDQIHRIGCQAIFAFWHGRIFPATWYWRNRGIVVMTSMNFDGEIIAACIRRHGYGVARGSSSRRGLQALAEMARKIRAGCDVGFTVDGPRGPRHVAKQGPVILARKTGSAIFCFHIALKHKVELRSWDRFQIPFPFTRAMLLAGPPLWIPEDATEAQVRTGHERMQSLLDDLRMEGEAWEEQVRAA